MDRSKIKSPSRAEINDLVAAIGGKDELLVILKDFYARMTKDLLIGYFFEGKDLNKIAMGQQHFILLAAGIIEKFEGKGPATAHIDLPPIFMGHFDRRLVMLRETLTARKIAPEWIERWVQFEESFRAVVVQKK